MKVQMKMRVFAVLLVVMTVLPARADWTWNIGYHNPAGAEVGLNLLHFWNNWAFEIGAGYFNAQDSKVTIAGDLDMKYLFGSGWFRPYLMGGVGYGTGALFEEGGGVSAGAGGGFLGGGVFLKGRPFYFYAGVAAGRGTTVQAGLGFDL
ncbi:MAG: hypothetical protein KF767_18940 [Bdellovibrionaceae bacterium]|nr:hypothetical protein [Pseudobdellovibrionaceae bacterium]